MPYSLLQLSTEALIAVAAGQIPAGLASRMEPGALPPAFVASRSLQLAAYGHPEPWSTSYLIVRDVDQRVVGGCGFKNAPSRGRVEVGYGVAPAARGAGAASAALELLLRRAFAAGAQEVLAEIAPGNEASTRVVLNAGFARISARVDAEGAYLLQWLRRRLD